MAEGAQRTGYFVSATMHAALLAALVFGFTAAPRYDDAPESVPVETITSTQLNEIMNGEKDAKPAPQAPTPTAEPTPPQPPVPPDPPPPEPPRRPDPPPPDPPPPAPPKRPEPEKPPPEPPKRPDPPKAETPDAPTPPQRPRPEKVEETPRPPDRPHPVKTEERTPAFKPDDIARALAKPAPEAKPKPAFDPTAISKTIGQTRTAELSPKAAPQGLPNHNAARMSVSLENALNEWFRDSYKNCWSLPPSNPNGENYVFDVRVSFNPDGSLSGRPVMLNPPHDPEWRAHADSVMRAVMRCNPLRVPTQYAPYFEQWRSKIIHFDPSTAEG